ncbi:MAG: HPP family protein [Candidatus Cybelea sp.]|jgi:CBS domain-containing membrane protein
MEKAHGGAPARSRILYTLLWCFVAMLVSGALAILTGRPFLFPSLGPSAIMLFGNPLEAASSPRNVLVGHFIGAGSGYAGLAATGLLGVPFTATMDGHRVLAAAIALALTAALTIATRSEHPPAGATTLIVSLGILPWLVDYLVIMFAVAALTLLALIVNRLRGVNYPIW